MMEVETRYICHTSDFFGAASVNATFKFQGCPPLTATWRKNCGKGTGAGPLEGLRVIEANSLIERPVLFENGKYTENEIIVPQNMDRIYLKFETDSVAFNFLHPYIKNLNSALTKMYPVLKGGMAYGGLVNLSNQKHLLLEFNCLGIEGTQDVTLELPAHRH
mmetsp:Transcript_31573/g.23414  ORF Transcript_31573/g.23414 Transcript_31573/m.23414 type:complete len:162 (+) Transcript_31573:318-803(+)